MVEMKRCTIHLTEQTILEINRAISKARDLGLINFSNEPIPDSDMSTDTYIREKTKRGIIFIKSDHVKEMEFWIDLRGISESAGYQLYYPEEAIKNEPQILPMN